MKRSLIVGLFALALNSIACASQVDEPLPAADSAETRESPEVLDESAALEPQALAQSSKPSWREITTCIRCAAARYRMHAQGPDSAFPMNRHELAPANGRPLAEGSRAPDGGAQVGAGDFPARGACSPVFGNVRTLQPALASELQ
jgi:hypothetical protein